MICKAEKLHRYTKQWKYYQYKQKSLTNNQITWQNTPLHIWKIWNYKSSSTIQLWCGREMEMKANWPKKWYCNYIYSTLCCILWNQYFTNTLVTIQLLKKNQFRKVISRSAITHAKVVKVKSKRIKIWSKIRTITSTPPELITQ